MPPPAEHELTQGTDHVYHEIRSLLAGLELPGIIKNLVPNDVYEGTESLVLEARLLHARNLIALFAEHHYKDRSDSTRLRIPVPALPIKKDEVAIYRAEHVKQARAAFQRFQWRWQKAYPAMVKRLEQDLPELLSFFALPKHLWRKLRTTNVIERCFVEVRRRTRPMVCFVNVHSVDRIIFSIFSRFNGDWKNRTLRVFTQAA